MSFLVFDIETRIDKTLLRQVEFGDSLLSDSEAYERMRSELQERGTDFFPVTYHVPVSIVLGRVREDHVLENVQVLPADTVGEAEIVRRFWSTLEAFDGTLVSFNGRAFDLPVLELQGLRWGCAASRYFSERDGLRARQGRHHDLYEFLANGGLVRLRGGFNLLSQLVGLPGKGSVRGGDVQQLWETGRYDTIHRYCRRDVIQTYYLFLHIERLRGRLLPERVAQIVEATGAFRAEIEDPP